MKHINTSLECESCVEKLKETVPYLKGWFEFIKKTFPDVHISWSFRDEASQNDFFEKGLSKVKWPESKHNVTRENEPASFALDLFFLSQEGKALYPEDLFSDIIKHSEANNYGVKWGGQFNGLKDLCHFEI